MEKHLPDVGNYVTTYVLMPKCKEMHTYDVFFNVLKNIVSRVAHAKWTSHNIEKSFMDGMLEETIRIDAGDILSDWQDFQSEDDQLWQARLLGFWSARNNPLFGKIFYGDKWTAPKRYGVSFGTKFNEPLEIDEIVKQKIKFRLIQLDVSKNTLPRLKNFITVPITDIGVENEQKISSQMKSFDVKEEHVQKCFVALLSGQWPRREENVGGHPEKLTTLIQSSVASSPNLLGKTKAERCDLYSVAKRLRTDKNGMNTSRTSSNVDCSSSVDFTKEKELQVPIEPSNNDEATAEPAFEKAQCPNISHIGLELLKDANCLQQIFHSMKVTAAKCESLAGQMSLSEQREKEIAKLLRQNEVLTAEKLQKDSLITSMQKGIDCMANMLDKFESMLADRDVELRACKGTLESIVKRNIELVIDSNYKETRIIELESMLADRDEEALLEYKTDLESNEKLNVDVDLVDRADDTRHSNETFIKQEEDDEEQIKNSSSTTDTSD